MYTGPHLIKDNLVFGYDTGYGVADNNTSTRFYPGEPTVNSLANTAVGSSGITFGSDSGGTYLETNSGTTGYNYIKVPNITVSSNETYTWSFELKSTETITQSGNKYYFDTNEYSNEFSTSNDQSRVSSSQVRPSSLPANEWVKFALTVTMKPNLTGAYSYDFLNFIKPHFTSKKIYYRNMQFEHNKSHHTPFVAGTRSSTQSLIDLKRTTSIDVSNISFDSTGQPEFDGTDDRVVSNAILVEGSQTFETVFMATENPHSPAGILTNHQYTSPQSNFGINYVSNSGNKLGASIGYTDGTREYSSKNTTYVVQQNVAIHAVLAYDQANNRIKWYINGELDSTHNLSKTPNFASIPVCSGRWTAAYNDYYFGGKVYIGKIYDKELTADEVKQNYNAYKNRFDI